MRIDWLSVSKYLDPIKPGEDVPVIIPGRCYAVLDGATDVKGSIIDGMASGRFAAVTVAAALAREVTLRPATSYGAEELIAALNARLGAELNTWSEKLGRAVSAATTLALMEVTEDHYRFTLVGDSGIRINGNEVFQLLKPVDDLMSTGRVLLHRLLEQCGVSGRELEAKSRQGVFFGFDAAVPELISAADAAEIIAASRKKLASDGFSSEILTMVEPMLRAGIAKGQYTYANDPDHVMGYASIDGTYFAGFGFEYFERPIEEVHSVEIFSDGYLDLPDTVSLGAWEAMAARIEVEDPRKVMTH